ncbi:MAG TPA: hypothetical protein VJI33_03150, partial [Candidatus Paceibacterota bacterium]
SDKKSPEAPSGIIELPLPGQEPETIPPELIGQNDSKESPQPSNVAAVGQSGINRFFGAIGNFFKKIFGGKEATTTVDSTKN